MKVGDMLEWLAGALFVVATYLLVIGSNVGPPLLVAGLFLTYQAQCWAAHPLKWRLRRPKLKLRRRRKGRKS